MTDQINEMVASACRNATVFSNRSETVMLTLFKTLIRPSVEYYSPLWNILSITDIQRVKGVLRNFIRHIAGCKQLNYWERLKRKVYILIQVCKIIMRHRQKAYRYMLINDHPKLGLKVAIPRLNLNAQRAST